MRNSLRLVAAAGLALGLLATGGVLLRPDTAATVGYVSTVDNIAAARERLTRLPGDWVAWAGLGLAYVQRARITGDPSSYPRAEEALRRSLAVRPDGNAAAHTGLGALAAARHDFTGALREGQTAVAADAFSAAAHGVVFDALVELGRYDEAAAAVQRMVDLRPDTGSYARASYLFELRGAVVPARDAMVLALESAPNREDVAFAHQHLGQLAYDAGDLVTAQSHVDEGLLAVPEHPPLRALQARIRAARGDLTGAVADLRAVVLKLPLPEYAVALADLLTVLGDTSGAEAQHELVRANATLLSAAGVAVDLDLAVYSADRALLDGVPLGPSTVDAARAAHATRPSVVSTDALAWTLHGAGRSAEALSYADAALRLGTRSAIFYYHRGMIRLATGDRAGARADLAEALRLNPYFSLRHVPIARAALTDPSRAGAAATPPARGADHRARTAINSVRAG